MKGSFVARLAVLLVVVSALYYAWSYLVPEGTRAQVKERVRAARGGAPVAAPPSWPARLAEAWRERRGSSILQTTDPNAYRVFLRSPLVFLTTRQKAESLRPLLGGATPWKALRELSLGKRRVPWGRFRFSHADPLT